MTQVNQFPPFYFRRRASFTVAFTHRSFLAYPKTVSIRHHMSTLKHSIRHQQAQLHHLENLLQLAPRMPMSSLNNTTSLNSSPPPSPLPDPSDHTPTTPNGKVIRRRSSFDILHSLAGPDSNLPLPRRDPGLLSQDGIREGVPMDFGTSPTSQSYKRQSSPTRTLSRACQSFRFLQGYRVTDISLLGIPVSSVGPYIRLYPSAYGVDFNYIYRECACPCR